MGHPITGRCLCGAVTFRLDGPPLAARACWCRDCQYLACGNAAVGMICTRESLVIAGVMAAFSSAADSGAAMRRSFCPACGTHLFSEAANAPGYIVVRAGALDDRELARPASMIWTASAPSWATFDPDLPQFTRHVTAVPDP